MRSFFIGSINYGQKPTCGETIKNQFLLSYLKNKISQLSFIDTINWRSKPFVLYQLLGALFNPQVEQIILSTCNLSSYRFFKLARTLGIKKKIIYFAIGGSLGDKIESGEYNKKYYLKLRKIVVEGEKIKQQLKEAGIINVEVVPNFKRIEYIPAKKFNDSTFRFVFLSRIIPQKGINLIFEAVRQLNQKFDGKFLVDFYGMIESTFQKEFLNQVAEIDNIEYKGFLNLMEPANFDILASYQSMLFPTFWPSEGFPGVIIDSYIAGLPVIASDWNLNAELVQNKVTGIIIPPYDASALEKAMELFLKKEIDIDNLIQNCRNRAYDYDVNHVLTEKLIHQLGINV